MKKILFTNRYTQIDSLVSAASNDFGVSLFQNVSESRKDIGGIDTIKVIITDFKLSLFFNKLLRMQTTVPTLVQNFNSHAKKIQPDTIVVYDFFHFVYWQSLSYVKKNPATKLILVSETKGEPRSFFSRILFKCFIIILKLNINSVDKVLVFTSSGERWFLEKFPTLAQERIIIPIETTVFKPVEEKNFLPDGKLRILINARYVSYKRHVDLLSAIKIITEKGFDVHVTCIGRAEKGIQEVKKSISLLSLSNHVTFLSPVKMSEMPDVYSHHDILVLPSDNEAIGMVVPEAMACGLPTITSDSVGANSYVIKGVTGFVFKTKNVRDLSECIEKFYNKQLIVSMSRSAKSHIANNFSFDSAAKVFVNALRL